MRFLKFYIIFLSLCISSVIVDLFSNDLQNLLGPGAANISPEDAKFIDELLSGISQEEKDKIFEEVNRFQQLSPQDQEVYLQDKFKEVENLSKGMPESPNVGHISSDTLPVDETDFEPIKSEEKSLSTSFKSTDMKSDLLSSLESLSSTIDTLLTNVKVLPRVSLQRKVEKDWLRLKTHLHNLESYIRIIQLKSKALKALSSDEYRALKNNLDTLGKRLFKMVENFDRQLPNTAGLTISFGEEDLAFDKNHIKKAQDILANIIDFLNSNLENNNINEDLKSLLKKHAPEELKKKELPNPAEPYVPIQRSYTTPSFGGGYDYNPGYYPYRPSYGGAGDFGGSTSSASAQAGQKGLDTKDESKKDKSPSGGGGAAKGKGGSPEGSKDKKDDKEKDATKSKGKDKEKDKDKDKDKNKKEDKKSKDNGVTRKKTTQSKKRTNYPNPEMNSFLRKLDEYLADVSNIIDKNSVDKLIKGEDKDIKDNFKKAFKLYDDYILKLSDGIAKRSQYLQQPAQDLLMKSIKEIYDDPDYELDKMYKKITITIPALEEKQKGERKILEDLFVRIRQLRLNLGLEKPEPVPQEDYTQDPSTISLNPAPSSSTPPVPGASVDQDGNVTFG